MFNLINTLVLVMVVSFTAYSKSDRWTLGSTASYKISGYLGAGFKTLSVTDVTDEKATVVETIYLGGQEKICTHIVNVNRDRTLSTQCAGAVPKYTHEELHNSTTMAYLGRETRSLATKAGTFNSQCSVYRVGKLEGRAFSVVCRSDSPALAFWGDVASAVSDKNGDKELIYIELVSLKKM